MSRARKIAKNTTVLFIAQIITYSMGFFITLYTARYLGAEGFGILSLALSITGITVIICDLGLGTLMVRDIARDNELINKYITNISIMKIFMSILMLGVTVLIVMGIGYSPVVSNVIYLITLSVIINTFGTAFYSVFQASEQMEYLSINYILNSSVMLAGTLIGIYYGFGVIYFAIIYVISNLITFLSTFSIYIWKFSLPKVQFDSSFWLPTIKEALPYGVAGIFVTLYYYIDSVMLSIMVNNEAVGWYNAAYRLVFLLLSLYNVYIIALFPVMSSFFKTSEDSLKFAFERSFKYMLIITLPIAVSTTLLADKVILLIYGSSYLPSIMVLQILIWTIVFMFLNGVATNLLGSINRQLIVTKVTGLGAFLNILLNFLLIPKFSIIGSSFATVITELAIFPIILYVMFKSEHASLKPLVKDLPKIMFATLIMGVAIIYLNSLNLFLIIIIATLVYLLTIIITKTPDDSDYEILKSILKRS